MRRAGLALAAVALAASAARADRMADVLDKRPFSAAPRELLEIARTAPPGDVIALRCEEDVSLDERGRATVRRRSVYVQRTGARRTLEAMWHPYYQDRPTLHARVVSPDGTATDLDAALVTE